VKLIQVNTNYGDYQIEETMAQKWGLEWSHATCEDEPAIRDAARDADVLVVALQPVTANLLDGLPRCRVIGRLGVGLDTIDVAAATARGIAVINVPDYCTEEVATHAVSLLLTLARKIPAADRLVRTDRWSEWHTLRPLEPLSALTLGVVGLGRIGQLVARYLKPLVKDIVAYDPYLTASPDADVTLVPFPELLERASLITLHAALTQETHHLFSQTAFSRMRPGAILVNVSRGGLIDEPALVEALEIGRLGGVGLDVIEVEPASRDHPLLRFENVTMTNHIAWYSEVSVIRQRTLMMERIRDYLEHRPVPSLVNPEVLAAGR
jgi:D-3-phosphoglycerate dehydrogenase